MLHHVSLLVNAVQHHITLLVNIMLLLRHFTCEGDKYTYIRTHAHTKENQTKTQSKKQQQTNQG